MGRMINKPVWQAEDGKEFTSQQEMLAYEGHAHYAMLIEDFIKTAGIGASMADRPRRSAETRVRRIVSTFLPYLEGRGLIARPVAPPTA